MRTETALVAYRMSEKPLGRLESHAAGPARSNQGSKQSNESLHQHPTRSALAYFNSLNHDLVFQSGGEVRLSVIAEFRSGFEVSNRRCFSRSRIKLVLRQMTSKILIFKEGKQDTYH